MAAVPGPGAVTADGCPVEVYRRLPALGEPELVHGWAPPGARVLDLGAGVGRIADPLVALGHDVLAVDSSAEMLAGVGRARTHLGDIAGLRLAERFDVVLLASHLVSTADAELRYELLTAAVRTWHPAAGCSRSGTRRRGSTGWVPGRCARAGSVRSAPGSASAGWTAGCSTQRWSTPSAPTAGSSGSGPAGCRPRTSTARWPAPVSAAARWNPTTPGGSPPSPDPARQA